MKTNFTNRRTILNARTKLNEAAIVMAVVIGSLVGIVTGSWLMFWLTVGGLVVAALCRNDIRISPQRDSRPRKRR